jgi:hypothetical protein
MQLVTPAVAPFLPVSLFAQPVKDSIVLYGQQARIHHGTDKHRVYLLGNAPAQQTALVYLWKAQGWHLVAWHDLDLTLVVPEATFESLLSAYQ